LSGPEYLEPPNGAEGLAASPAAGLSQSLLQRHQTRNIERHLFRDALRIGVLIAADLALFVGLRWLIYGLRDGWMGAEVSRFLLDTLPWGSLDNWRFAVALTLSLWLVGAYRAGHARRDGTRLLQAAAVAALLILFHDFWTENVVAVLGKFATLTVIFAAGLVLTRRAVDAVVWRIRPRVAVSRTLVVAHTDADWRDLARMLTRVRDLVVVGNVTLYEGPRGGIHPRLRGLSDAIEECRAETVLLWGHMTAEEFGFAVDVALTSGCRLLAGARTSVGGVEPRSVWVGGRQLVELTPPTLSGWQLVLKRGADLVGSGLGLVALAPLFAVIAMAIRRDSPGPVLFRQPRVGRLGRRFTVLKFRTMLADASEDVHREHVRQQIRQHGMTGRSADVSPTFKLVADPRVTRIGRWLRRTSLDELPQLINVLRGEMSLVGPRPPLYYEIDAYEPWQYLRLAVRPGITGLWQVSGRSRVSYFDMCKLDVEYVRTWSVWLDLKILFLTVPVVFFNSGEAA